MNSNDVLTEQERIVLAARAAGKTYAQCGELIGKSRERARQVDYRANHIILETSFGKWLISRRRTKIVG